MFLNIIIHWDKVALIVSGVILVQALLKEVFGVTMLGKKIYKGAPAIWKRMMVARNFRLEMRETVKSLRDELKEVRDEFKWNGGSTSKDMITRLVNSDSKKTEILSRLDSKMNQLSLWVEINDVISDQMKFRMDEKGACTSINEAFLNTFGYTWRDLQGFNWETIIHDDDIEEVRDRWKRAIETKSRYCGDQRIVSKNGDIDFVRVTGYPIIEGEELKGYYGTVEIINSN